MQSILWQTGLRAQRAIVSNAAATTAAMSWIAAHPPGPPLKSEMAISRAMATTAVATATTAAEGAMASKAMVAANAPSLNVKHNDIDAVCFYSAGYRRGEALAGGGMV